MRKLIFFISMLFIFQNCDDNSVKDDRRLEEVSTEGESAIQKIIRNPVTANSPTDTVNVAKMSFSKDTFFFGVVNEGDVITHQFEFENTGMVPLLIHDARSTCGCTIPKWPKEPIEPGTGGTIKVEFNTENKDGFQHKPVTVKANTYPNATVVHLVGEVKKKK